MIDRRRLIGFAAASTLTPFVARPAFAQPSSQQAWPRRIELCPRANPTQADHATKYAAVRVPGTQVRNRLDEP